jgi:hypothetical protein
MDDGNDVKDHTERNGRCFLSHLLCYLGHDQLKSCHKVVDFVQSWTGHNKEKEVRDVREVKECHIFLFTVTYFPSPPLDVQGNDWR